MSKWIERYVYDVTRRLPEGERAEVEKELTAGIYDMLPDEPSEEEIKSVLCGFGPPNELAVKYQQKPKYLISPAIYDDYIHALKYVLPIVGVTLLLVGMVISGLEYLRTGTDSIAKLIAETISDGIAMAISGLFQALLWTTVGFVIYERTQDASKASWKPESLPEIPDSRHRTLPLSDGIVELVLSVVFGALAILVCSGVLNVPFRFTKDDIVVTNIFSDSFLRACVPAIIVVTVLAVAEGIAKIKVRRWTAPVCIITVLGNIAAAVTMILLVLRDDIFTAEFSSFLAETQWGSLDLIRLMGEPVLHGGRIVIIIIAVVAALGSSISAIYKTVRKPK